MLWCTHAIDIGRPAYCFACWLRRSVNRYASRRYTIVVWASPIVRRSYCAVVPNCPVSATHCVVAPSFGRTTIMTGRLVAVRPRRMAVSVLLPTHQRPVWLARLRHGHCSSFACKFVVPVRWPASKVSVTTSVPGSAAAGQATGPDIASAGLV